MKEKEINELKNKLSRYPIDLSEREKLLSITIMTKDESIRENIICKNTDKFINIENKLYQIYPECFKIYNSFSINGKTINKMKNLDENKISNSDIIILNIED